MSAFSKWFENRCHALALYLLFYNFCRVHESAALPAAMAAGVVDRTLKMEDCHCVTDAEAPRRGPAGGRNRGAAAYAGLSARTR